MATNKNKKPPAVAKPSPKKKPSDKKAQKSAQKKSGDSGAKGAAGRILKDEVDFQKKARFLKSDLGDDGLIGFDDDPMAADAEDEEAEEEADEEPDVVDDLAEEDAESAEEAAEETAETE